MDIFTFSGEYYNGKNDFVIVDGGLDDEDNEKLAEQIKSALKLQEKIKEHKGEYIFALDCACDEGFISPNKTTQLQNILRGKNEE